jgi:hypothetical protein
MAVHDCAAVAALRAAYVKAVLRPTKKKMLPLSLPPPFPATALLKMLPILKTMPTKTLPDIPTATAAAAAAATADTETMKPKMMTIDAATETATETKTETKTEETTKTETTKQTKTKKKKTMKHDDEDKEKKKLEEVPPLKDPDHDTGVSPVDPPGDPRMDGTSLHLPSPTALPLQGPFPGD